MRKLMTWLVILVSTGLAVGKTNPTPFEIAKLQNELNEIVQTRPGTKLGNTAEQQLRELIRLKLTRNGNWPAVKHSLENAPGSNYLLDAVESGQIIRWTDMPITVSVASADYLGPNGKPLLQAAITGLAKLQAASRGKIEFTFVNDPANADITVNWVTQQAANTENGSVMGNTTMIIAGHTLLQAQITVAPFTKTGRNIKPSEMELLMEHEGMHALGIDGHSPNTNDIMFYRYSAKVKKTFTDRDRTTLAMLYQLKPTITENDQLTGSQKQHFKEALNTGITLEARGEDGWPSLQTAANLDPNDASLQNWLGLAEMEQGQYERARVDFQNACRLCQTWPDPHANLAKAIVQSVDRHRLKTQDRENQIELAKKEMAMARELSGNAREFGDTNELESADTVIN